MTLPRLSELNSYVPVSVHKGQIDEDLIKKNKVRRSFSSVRKRYNGFLGRGGVFKNKPKLSMLTTRSDFRTDKNVGCWNQINDCDVHYKN